jgi:hypothetical protein
VTCLFLPREASGHSLRRSKVDHEETPLIDEHWHAHLQMQAKLRAPEDLEEFPGVSVATSTSASQHLSAAINTETAAKLWSAIDNANKAKAPSRPKASGKCSSLGSSLDNDDDKGAPR